MALMHVDFFSDASCVPACFSATAASVVFLFFTVFSFLSPSILKPNINASALQPDCLLLYQNSPAIPTAFCTNLENKFPKPHDGIPTKGLYFFEPA